MEKVKVEMSKTEYKRYLAFKEADKVVKSIKKGLGEVREARKGNITLKSAQQL